MKETIVRINGARDWFFERMDRIDRPLVRLIGKKGERISLLIKTSVTSGTGETCSIFFNTERVDLLEWVS